MLTTCNFYRLAPIIGYLVYINTFRVMEATLVPASEPAHMPNMTHVSRGPSARFCGRWGWVSLCEIV